MFLEPGDCLGVDLFGVDLLDLSVVSGRGVNIMSEASGEPSSHGVEGANRCGSDAIPSEDFCKCGDLLRESFCGTMGYNPCVDAS